MRKGKERKGKKGKGREGKGREGKGREGKGEEDGTFSKKVTLSLILSTFLRSSSSRPL